MADDCHFKKNEKSLYFKNGLTACHEIWHIDA